MSVNAHTTHGAPQAMALMYLMAFYRNTRPRTMSFVMPKDIPAEKAPAPRDPRIDVTDVAEGELLAVREFPGESWLKL